MNGSEVRRLTLTGLPARARTDREMEETVFASLGRADAGVTGANNEAMEWLDESTHPQVEGIRIDETGGIWAFDQQRAYLRT